MDMPRARSSVLVAFYKAMQLETIGLGLAQKNYRKIIRYDIGYAYTSSKTTTNSRVEEQQWTL